MFCLWPLRAAVKQHDLVPVKVSEDSPLVVIL